MGINRRWKIAWIAVAIATAGLLSSNGLASGQTVQPSTSTLLDGGYLNLRFPDVAAAATFTQYAADRSTVLTGPQNITTASNCGVNGVNPGTPDLAKVTSSGGTVGAETSGTKFVGLGVKGRTSSGINCGRIDPSENLSVALGSGLKTVDLNPALSGLAAVAAELDIDGKGNALVRANLFNGGTSPAGFALLSTTAPSGDSGPDATSGDNFAFPINAGMPACGGTQSNPTPPASGQICGTFVPFSSLTLSTSSQPSGSPSFALEGGRSTDPRSAFSWDTYRLRLATPDSVFKLAKIDGVLGCTTGNNTATQTDTTSNISTTLTRAPNSDGSTCVLIPFNFDLKLDDSGAAEVDLQKDLLGQTGVNFTWSITWPPEPTPPTKVTRIDYGDAAGLHPVQWCEAGPTQPAGEFWCFTNRVETLINSGTYAGMAQVTETFYGAGDPRTLH
jgi:hypothetical protein